MRNGKYDRNAVCPFYQSIVRTKGDKVIAIACECVSDNLGFDVQTLLRFRSLNEMDDYFDLFCSDLNDKCPYYDAIAKKYDK